MDASNIVLVIQGFFLSLFVYKLAWLGVEILMVHLGYHYGEDEDE